MNVFTRTLLLTSIVIASLFGCSSPKDDIPPLKGHQGPQEYMDLPMPGTGASVRPRGLTMNEDGTVNYRNGRFRLYDVTKDSRSHAPSFPEVKKTKDEMTDEELAQHSLSVGLFIDTDGTTTELVQELSSVDIPRIRAALAKDKAGVRFKGDAKIPGLVHEFTNAVQMPPKTGEESPLYMFAPENRSWLNFTAAQSYPNNTSVSLHNTSINYYCSATLIGYHTAMTAAHCIFNALSPELPNYHQNFPFEYDWSRNLVRTQVPGQSVVEQRGYPTSATAHNGFYVWYQSDWANINTTNFSGLDMAVIDFAYDWPGYSSAWIPAGTGNTTGVDYAGWSTEAAYDGGSPLPSQPGSFNYVFPSLIYRGATTNSIWVTTSDTNALSSYLDVTPGASGSGILNQIFYSQGDYTYYWAGNAIGECAGGACPNQYLRLNSARWTFIVAYASEFP